MIVIIMFKNFKRTLSYAIILPLLNIIIHGLGKFVGKIAIGKSSLDSRSRILIYFASGIISFTEHNFVIRTEI